METNLDNKREIYSSMVEGESLLDISGDGSNNYWINYQCNIEEKPTK